MGTEAGLESSNERLEKVGKMESQRSKFKHSLREEKIRNSPNICSTELSASSFKIIQNAVINNILSS